MLISSKKSYPGARGPHTHADRMGTCPVLSVGAVPRPGAAGLTGTSSLRGVPASSPQPRPLTDWLWAYARWFWGDGAHGFPQGLQGVDEPEPEIEQCARRAESLHLPVLAPCTRVGLSLHGVGACDVGSYRTCSSCLGQVTSTRSLSRWAKPLGAPQAG